ncbi:UvrD-like helicase family protein [Mucilaginibacter frigoritolerans]|uniref:UvrD-like helicase family protein n=1 Tax=Mucilaginibacter frigoritolerans TaxID=652788 RepID=A0A562U6N9_9SPHI|nr:AAA family ATPase [Mucilaginibacter frigoritolerans]TWJ00831.1 UvrD-like helicase family protein [Mucilaginibacter frigoritolerans]
MWIILLIIFIIVISNMFSKSGSKSTTKAITKYPTIYPVTKKAPTNYSIPSKKKFIGKNKLPEGLIITDEFNKAFDLMENSTKCAYITGKAGTGKSTLLTYFRQKTRKNVIVLAPTGIAAIQVEGSTIHSFFRFAPQLLEKKHISKDYARQDLFNKVNMIIIDEISMVRADLLDGIDYALRINRNNNTPFGGVQMVFFGDLYQLPPVVVGKDLTQYFEEHFGGIYFFNAKVFREINLEYIELQKIFRQKDSDFKDILNSIREAKVSALELLVLNKRYIPYYINDTKNVSLTLTTTNNIADDVNRNQMNSLQSKEYIYNATISGKFDKASYPTEPYLSLKKGAQIMMLKNDSQKRWVNGSLGIIQDLSSSNILIKIDNVTYTIEKATWEVIEYEYNKEENKIEAIVTGSFTQYPLKPAWAMTIHKSQGQTFDNVIIDLGNGAFAHGQTYVALSRCTSLEGIVLKSQIRYQDIILDSKVANFIKEKKQYFIN